MVIIDVLPLFPNFRKYCLNITDHMVKTGYSRLKVVNASAIPATTCNFVVYLSELVKIFFSPTTIESPSPDFMLSV